MTRWRWLAALVGVAWLAGCAVTPAWRADPTPDQRQCRARLAAFDAAVAEAGVGDAGAARIEGFPYLRTDRLLASFADELHDSSETPRHADWLARLRGLDAEARRIEAANLPADIRHRLTQRFGDAPAVAANACAERLLGKELQGKELLDGELRGPEDRPARRALHEAIEMPDHYVDSWRALGLYPLTRLGLAWGYTRWREEYLATFGRPFPASAEVRRYAPEPLANEGLDVASAARLVREAPRSPLGMLALDDAHLRRLAAYHAPAFAIETRSHDDRPGTPVWRRGAAGPRPGVDTTRPEVDVRLAHTRFHGVVLPQLVYTLWFPARTRQGNFDILGGRLDGVVWRVTLGEDGRPLIYDSIHACGCYHLFFPVPPLRRVPVAADHDLREAPLTPMSAPSRGEGERLRLRLAAVSHYLVGIESARASQPSQATYALTLAREPPRFGQRSLALPDGGRRSLYGPEGIVSASARRERFILWPAGIRSPGAMRQWGTHATVFVGRRHFDEPYLFESAFALP
ncbi:hypothetical protein [Halomonas organivorans]|uniref:Uncharacterized protein n=1 Tax=Halomonas organivorans TaxID=257772 RepID=A0A7W5G3U0_9GAMM|nr:hypothetical protein [Halomonas organivorans]MBB3139250.1 hypothetical protein [Halomonas organivorans]